MRTILQLIVLAALVVAVVEYVLPAMRNREAGAPAAGGSLDSGESGAWDCVEAASAASEGFAAATRAAAVPTDGNRGYSTIVAEARAAIEEARARCSCDHVACGKGDQALDALGEVVNSYADMLAGTALSNPATAQERVVQLLSEAREAAGAS